MCQESKALYAGVSIYISYKMHARVSLLVLACNVFWMYFVWTTSQHLSDARFFSKCVVFVRLSHRQSCVCVLSQCWMNFLSMEKGIKRSWAFVPFVKPGYINVLLFYEMINQCLVGWESQLLVS